MNRKLAFFWIAAALSILALPALAEPDHAAVWERVLEKHIAPGYTRLAASSGELADAVTAACAEDNDSAHKVRAAFNKTVDDWQSVQHIRSGPAAVDERHSRIQFWPDKRDIAGRHLSRLLATGEPEDLAAERLSAGSVAVQGFPALERLIFRGAGLTVPPQDGMKLSRCKLAAAVSRNVHTIAVALSVEASTAGAFGGDPETVLRNVLTDLVTGFDVIQRLKLRLPAGKERPRPRLAENWRSGRSLRNVAINLAALRELYMTMLGPDGADAKIHQAIIERLDTSTKTVKSMAPDLQSQLQRDGGRRQLTDLAATVEELRVLVANYLTGKLNLELGFNSLDGD